MKTLMKSKEMKVAEKIFFIAFFVMIFSFMINVSVNAAGAKSHEQTVSQIDQTPMYSDPKFTNENLNIKSTENNNQNKLNAPPPGDPNPGDQIPVSSSILPLLAMALGLGLWKLHFQLKKVKK